MNPMEMSSMKLGLAPIFLLTAAAGMAQSASALKRTDARDSWLLGPIKSVSTTVQRTKAQFLQPDGPTLLVPLWCPDCQFDPDGTKTMNGQIRDGRFLGEWILLQRDSSGRVIERRIVDASTGEIRNEDVFGPTGSVESTAYMQGKLHSRQTIQYDPNGYPTDYLRYDAGGHLLEHQQQAHTQDGRYIGGASWGENGLLDWRDTIDPKTGAEQFARFDEAGGYKLKFSYDQGKVAFFELPTLQGRQFGDSFSNMEARGDIPNYKCHNDGSCDLSHIHYEYLGSGKFNPTTAEWRNAQGELLYAVYTEYEVDAFHNWTHRKISVITPELTERTLYEEDSRVLAYWPR